MNSHSEDCNYVLFHMECSCRKPVSTIADDGVELARLVVEQFGTVNFQSEPTFLAKARSILARVDGHE